MSRTIFVALCAVAVLAMAPFAYSEDNVPPNPVTDAHRELAIGMTLAEWQPIVEKRLGWTKPEKSEYFAEGSTERREKWTWDAQTKGGPNEPQWHFHLEVVLVEDVIRSTMYFAEASRCARKTADTGKAKTEKTVERPADTRLERAFKELEYGMTEDEARAVVKKYTVESLPDGNGSTVYVGEKVHTVGSIPQNGPPERWIDWEGDSYSDASNWARDRAEPMELHTRFSADDHLYFATYRSKVEIRFPHDDLMLRKDGVHPWNYAK